MRKRSMTFVLFFVVSLASAMISGVAWGETLQIGYVDSGTGLPTATASSWCYSTQIKNQSMTPAEPYIKAVGQTFMTPDSTQNMVVTNFAVQFTGAAFNNNPTDVGADYTVQFKLFDSNDNLLMTKTGTYRSYGWHHHFEKDLNSETNGWLFTDTDTSSLPVLTANTSYYWEVEVLSVTGANASNGTGLYASCVNNADGGACNWMPNGGGYYRNSEGTTSRLWSWTETVDTNFTMLFETVATPVLAVSTNSLTLGSDAGSDTFDVMNTATGTLEWTATSDSAWLSVSPASGTDDTTVTVTYLANATDDVRSGTITISGSGQTETITVKQGGSGVIDLADYIEDPGFEGPHNSPYETLSPTIPLNGWTELFPGSGFDFYQNAGETRAVTGGTAIAAAEGSSFLRTFVFNNSTTWNGVDAGRPDDLSTTEAPIPLIPGKTYAMTFKVSKDTANYWCVQMDHMLIRVRGTTTWEDYGNEYYYFTPSTTPAGYTTIGLTNGEWTTLTYEFTYTGSIAQQGYLTIKFFRNSSIHSTLCLDAISSSEYPASIVATPSALHVASSNAGSTETFDIQTSGAWTITSDSAWLTAGSASGSGNATVTATCGANSSVLPRTGTLTITGSLGTKLVAVTQAGAPATIFADNFAAFDTTRWLVFTSEAAKGNLAQPNGEYVDFFTNSSPYSRDVYITNDGQLALPINAGDTYQMDNNFSNAVLTPTPADWKAVTVKIKGSSAFDDPISYDQFSVVLWGTGNNLVKFGFTYFDSTSSDPKAGHMIVGGTVETDAVCHTQFGGIDDTVNNDVDLVLRVEKNVDGTYKYSISKDNGATMTVVADNVAFADAGGTEVQLPDYIGVYAGAGRYTDANGDYDPTSNRSVDVLVDAFIVSGPGDANLDGAVDVGDLGILAANYGGTGKTWAEGDFNGDGTVDVGDLGILAANYGTGSSSSADFDADYAKVFGSAADDASADENEDTTSSLCGSLGLSLIAGLVLMGLMIVKLDE